VLKSHVQRQTAELHLFEPSQRFSSHLSHRFFHFLKPGTDDRFALLNGDHATRELTAVPAGQVRRMVAIAWTEGHLRGACQVPAPGSG
jgi:hypothetical protein